jgi:hypothetical protein
MMSRLTPDNFSKRKGLRGSPRGEGSENSIFGARLMRPGVSTQHDMEYRYEHDGKEDTDSAGRARLGIEKS